MKKTVKVHMLPTQDDSHLSIIRGSKLHYYKNLLNVSPDRVPQHLYFTSDDEIKVDDWCFEMYNGDSKATTPNYIDENGNRWWLRKMNMNCSSNDPECRKVIATTDPKLEYSTVGYTENRARTFYQKLPQIPKRFIEEYAQAKGITEVKVKCGEYCEYCGQEYCDNLRCRGYADTFRYDEEDNGCVIIVPNKPKLYTKEEVEKLCRDAYKQGQVFSLPSQSVMDKQISIDDWIKENVK